MNRFKILIVGAFLACTTFAGCSKQCMVCPEIIEGVKYTIIKPDGTTQDYFTDVNGCIPFTIPDGANCSDYILDDRGIGPILE